MTWRKIDNPQIGMKSLTLRNILSGNDPALNSIEMTDQNREERVCEVKVGQFQDER